LAVPPGFVASVVTADGGNDTGAVVAEVPVSGLDARSVARSQTAKLASVATSIAKAINPLRQCSFTNRILLHLSRVHYRIPKNANTANTTTTRPMM
jgi:hypothetical protein